MAQQPAEVATGIDEEQDEAHKEHAIACISDADTPGIVVYTEIAALVVGVVAGLVEPVVAIAENSVHRHGGVEGLVAVDDGKVGLIVFGGVGAGMIAHVEAVELQVERQLLSCHPGIATAHIVEEVGGLVATKMDDALLRAHMGDESSHEDDHQGQMYDEGNDGVERNRLTPQLADEPRRSCGHKHRPKTNEPPRAINHRVGGLTAYGVFHDGGHGHGDDQKDIENADSSEQGAAWA